MYNAEKFIASMIKAIQNQSYTNFEVIIVDDQSTDNSVEVVKKMVSYDSRFHLFVRPNLLIKGAQSCRNYAINFVNGTYLIYLDADDLIASYCFEQRVDYLENHPELDFAVFPMIGFKKQLMDVDTILYGYRENGNDISNLVRRTLPFVVVTNIYRLDFIRENSIEWDIKLKSFQDSDFNLSVIAVGGKYCYSNLKPDYYYRISGNEHSISKKIITSVHVDSHIYFFEKQFNRLHNGNLYENDFLVFSRL